MVEPLTTAASAVIAKVVLDKFYEGLGSKLGEKAVEAAIAPIKKLSEIVWKRCFPDSAKAQHALEAAGQGNADALAKVQAHLRKQLKVEAIAKELEPLAKEIQQVIVNMEDVNARNAQQVFGGQGLQVNDPNQPVIQVQGNPTFNFGERSEG